MAEIAACCLWRLIGPPLGKAQSSCPGSHRPAAPGQHPTRSCIANMKACWWCVPFSTMRECGEGCCRAAQLQRSQRSLCWLVNSKAVRSAPGQDGDVAHQSYCNSHVHDRHPGVKVDVRPMVAWRRVRHILHCRKGAISHAKPRLQTNCGGSICTVTWQITWQRMIARAVMTVRYTRYLHPEAK